MEYQATPELREQVSRRAAGRCECTMATCAHHRGRRCNVTLVMDTWELHRRTAGGPYEMSNVIAMCQTCHTNTRTYGVGPP